MFHLGLQLGAHHWRMVHLPAHLGEGHREWHWSLATNNPQERGKFSAKKKKAESPEIPPCQVMLFAKNMCVVLFCKDEMFKKNFHNLIILLNTSRAFPHAIKYCHITFYTVCCYGDSSPFTLLIPSSWMYVFKTNVTVMKPFVVKALLWITTLGWIPRSGLLVLRLYSFFT